MYNIAKITDEERVILFRNTADKKNLSEGMISSHSYSVWFTTMFKVKNFDLEHCCFCSICIMFMILTFKELPV